MTFYRYDGRRGFFSSPTNCLIVANVAVFVVMLLSGDAGQCSSFVCRVLAQENDLVFQGLYWQLLTSMFVHFGFTHILFNMFGLYYFGHLNEMKFGSLSFFTIYFVSGLLGNIMSLFILPGSALSGGASGAIFGLVGSYVAIARQAKHMGIALVYAVVIFVQSSGFGVNIVAHLFGLIGGLVLGLLLSYLDNQTRYSYST